MDNYRHGAKPDVEVATSCQLEVKIILGADEFLDKGVYKEIEDYESLKDKRTLILDTGDKALELALKLTEYTGRVIVVTSSKSTPGSMEIQKKLKLSDVKILYQSELLEIKGTNDVEKVVLQDFEENEKFELYVDAIVILDKRYFLK
ncbi:MAG: NAD-binding protein [Promethearchaeota archaeon]